MSEFLLIVALSQVGRYRCEEPKQSGRSSIRTGVKEKAIGWPRVGIPCPKCKRPKAIVLNRLTILVHQRSLKTTSNRVEGDDLAASKLAD